MKSVKFSGFLGASGLVFIGGISAAIGRMVKKGGFLRGCSDRAESVLGLFCQVFCWLGLVAGDALTVAGLLGFDRWPAGVVFSAGVRLGRGGMG